MKHARILSSLSSRVTSAVLRAVGGGGLDGDGERPIGSSVFDEGDEIIAGVIGGVCLIGACYILYVVVAFIRERVAARRNSRLPPPSVKPDVTIVTVVTEDQARQSTSELEGATPFHVPSPIRPGSSPDISDVLGITSPLVIKDKSGHAMVVISRSPGSGEPRISNDKGQRLLVERKDSGSFVTLAETGTTNW